MPRFFVTGKRISTRALRKAIQDRWECLIKSEEGQVISRCHTTPNWHDCVLVSVIEAGRGARIIGLELRGVDLGTSELLELIIPCDDEHMIGAKEIGEARLAGDRSDPHNQLHKILMEVALNAGVIREEKFEEICHHEGDGFFY